MSDLEAAQWRFQDILDGLEPQEDEGDLTGLAEEIEEWAPLRREATTVLLGESPAPVLRDMQGDSR